MKICVYLCTDNVNLKLRKRIVILSSSQCLYMAKNARPEGTFDNYRMLKKNICNVIIINTQNLHTVYAEYSQIVELFLVNYC